MTSEPKALFERVLNGCLVLLGCALALTWAWALLQPLLPVLVTLAVVAAVGLVVTAYVRRRRSYW